ncbi:MAG: ATP-binding cassette domain-containing protein [Candidatus Omnitrophica bacterium]|nr:ATP-binding cassette domain-containing protein [Candidatus Omnitrophota bacterium]
MATNTYLISLQDVEVSYPRNGNGRGGRNVILNNVRLNIRAGEFLSLVGPTGCGKSTVLRLILGAQFPTRGQALVEGQAVTGVNRDRGIVFQKYSLFPHLKVVENIAFGPLLERTSILQRVLHTPVYRRIRRQYLEEAQEYLARIGLNPGDGEKYPYELSGGMQQRVAIAQALMMQPTILLMDEPFGALDHNMRLEMQLLILEQWDEYRMTIIFVTHDLEEACYVGTRVIGLSQYWSDDVGQPGVGAVIVTDLRTPGGHPKPTAIRATAEFNALLEQVRHDALDPDNRQRLHRFNLTHQDALKPEPLSAAEVREPEERTDA